VYLTTTSDAQRDRREVSDTGRRRTLGTSKYYKNCGKEEDFCKTRVMSKRNRGRDHELVGSTARATICPWKETSASVYKFNQVEWLYFVTCERSAFQLEAASDATREF